MAQFGDGEKVLCFHGRLLYEAKCLKSKIIEDHIRYLVHYIRWNNRHDEWVPESRIFKYNDANVQKQKELFKKYDDQPLQNKKISEADMTDRSVKKKMMFENRSNEDEHMCTSCKKTFSSQSDIDKHWQWHVEQLEHMQSCCVKLEEIEVFNCKFCTSCFTEIEKLRRHEEKCFNKRKKIKMKKTKQKSILRKRTSPLQLDPEKQSLTLQSMHLQLESEPDISMDETKTDLIRESQTNQKNVNKHYKIAEDDSNEIPNNEGIRNHEHELNSMEESDVSKMRENEISNVYQNDMNKIEEKCIVNENSKMDQNQTFEVDENKTKKYGNTVNQNYSFQIGANEVTKIIRPKEICENRIIYSEENKMNRIDHDHTAGIHQNETNEINKNRLNNIDYNKISKMKNNQTYNDTCNEGNLKTYEININENNSMNENGINSINENKLNKMVQKELDENDNTNVDESEKRIINEIEMDEGLTKKTDQNDMKDRKTNNTGEHINNIHQDIPFKMESQLNRDNGESSNEYKTSSLFYDRKRKYSNISQSKPVNSDTNYSKMYKLQLEHMQSCQVHLSHVKIFKCDFCSSCFPDTEKLRIHMRKYFKRDITTSLKENEIEKPFECEVCGWRFVKESTLKTHSVLHEPFPHMCECGIGYYLKLDLEAHKRLVHPEYKPPASKAKPKPSAIKIKQEIKRESSPDTDTQPHKQGPRLKASLTYKQPKAKNKTIIRIKLKEPQQRRVRVEMSLEADENGLYSCTLCPQKRITVEELRVHLYTDHTEKYASGYRCKICGKTKTLASNLMYHIMSHAGLKPFKCKICSKVFSQKGALNLHSLRHTDDRQFHCKDCDKSFYNRSNLVLHSRVHTGEKPYVCNHCGKGFSDPSAYKRHLIIHSGLKPYQCAVCSKAFCDPAALFRHKRLHANYTVQCSVCNRTFSTRDAMVKHHRLKHTKFTDKYECDHCGFQCTMKRYLVNHIKCSHSEDNPKVECDICGKKILVCNFKHHLRRVHLKISKYECDLCGWRFYSNCTMEKHKKHAHRSKIAENSFECDYCHKTFFSKSIVGSHIVSMHLGIVCQVCKKAFSSSLRLKKHKAEGCRRCNVCDKAFPTPMLLEEHYIRNHLHPSEQQPYECDYCNKQFPVKARLLSHIRRHTEKEITFICHHCGKGFRSRYMIVNHLRALHTVNLYCNICMKKFYRESDFIEHKRASGCSSQEVACEICNKAFRNKYVLKGHVARVHYALKIFECDLCGNKFKLKTSLARHIKLVHSV